MRDTNLNVIEYEMFKGDENICIVLAEDGYSRFTSAFVGPITSDDERECAENIVRTGHRLTKSAAEAIFGPQHFFKT